MKGDEVLYARSRPREDPSEACMLRKLSLEELSHRTLTPPHARGGFVLLDLDAWLFACPQVTSATVYHPCLFPLLIV